MVVDNNLQMAAKLTEADVCDAVTQAGENEVVTDDDVEENQPAVHIPTNKEMQKRFACYSLECKINLLNMSYIMNTL